MKRGKKCRRVILSSSSDGPPGREPCNRISPVVWTLNKKQHRFETASDNRMVTTFICINSAQLSHDFYWHCFHRRARRLSLGIVSSLYLRFEQQRSRLTCASGWCRRPGAGNVDLQTAIPISCLKHQLPLYMPEPDQHFISLSIW